MVLAANSMCLEPNEDAEWTAETLSGVGWTRVGSVVAGADGRFHFEDSDAPNHQTCSTALWNNECCAAVLQNLSRVRGDNAFNPWE